MFRYSLWVAGWVLGLAGCAAAPPAPSAAAVPWHDQAFAYNPALVTTTQEDLFRLDPELLRQLQDPAVQALQSNRRLSYLLDLLFGPKRQRFTYAAGHSTVAAETWRRQRGDCLSLTLLTFAAARAMNMTGQMQEVVIPPLYDRRKGFDFVNHHVNVRFNRAHWNRFDSSGYLRDVIVDFEPEFASTREGHPLAENAILARFYNNLAVEHLTQGRSNLAYAHFKAAIVADPAYAAGYTNLAVLYRDAAMTADAEQLLRRAVALSDSDDVAVPLLSLQQLLVDQGRDAEAQHYAQLLQAARERDPYHWIDLGIRHLQDGEYRSAIGALEHASGMASGFTEVHRYLALAYWRTGNVAGAKEQLALLESLDRGDASLATLRQKFGSTTH